MTHTHRPWFAAVAVVVTALAYASLHNVVSAQAAPQAGQHDHDAAAPAAGGRSMMAGRGMMASMPDMGKNDAKIAALAKKMNESRGDAKVTAMGDLLNALLEDRAAMHAQMTEMHTHMESMMSSMMSSMPGKAPAPGAK